MVYCRSLDRSKSHDRFEDHLTSNTYFEFLEHHLAEHLDVIPAPKQQEIISTAFPGNPTPWRPLHIFHMPFWISWFRSIRDVLAVRGQFIGYLDRQICWNTCEREPMKQIFKQSKPPFKAEPQLERYVLYYKWILSSNDVNVNFTWHLKLFQWCTAKNRQNFTYSKTPKSYIVSSFKS